VAHEKYGDLLTRPILAATSPARPESAKAASSPRNAPCPSQGRSVWSRLRSRLSEDQTLAISAFAW